MLILSVETSTPMGSIALMRNDFLLGEYTIYNRLYHSQIILKMTDSLLKESGVALPEVDLFAVSTGPGSFTGLRVGIATVKGLAVGLNKPVTGIPTLEAFAARVPFSPFPICPVIPARRDEVYTALFQYNDSLKLSLLKPARVISIRGLLEELEGPVHLLGEVPEDLIEKNSKKVIYDSPLYKFPRASAVALAAFQKQGEGRGEEPRLIMPDYPSEKVQTDGLCL